jgi:Phage integrase, N-terminal SAM-like domain
MESRPKKLLDQVRDAIRVKHYARNTEQAYVYWIKNLSSSIINAIPKRWVLAKFRLS